MYTTNAQYFRELIRILERQLDALNKPDCCCYDFTLTQCHTLIEIGRSQSLSLKELALKLSLDASTMSRTVETLVQNDWVLRAPSTVDRRSIEIKLSDKGIDLFNQIECSMAHKFNTIFGGIPSEEQSNVLTSLELITNAFEKHTNL